MTNQEAADAIVEVLNGSGLGFDDQVKAISMARVAIQPRASQTDWRLKAKPIERPSGGLMGKSRRQAEPEEKGKKVEK